MIYHARQDGWPTIDITPSVTVIHQSHDYTHLPDGRAHYDLAESDHNRALAGGKAHMYIILDADWQLVNGQLQRPRPGLPRLLRQMELKITPEHHIANGLRRLGIRGLRRLRRRLLRSSP